MRPSGPFLTWTFLLAFFLACDRPDESPKTMRRPVPGTVLDELLVGEEIRRQVQTAEQNLPSDTWTSDPRGGRHNSSRGSREIVLAHELIDQLKPGLKQMSAQELLTSLKTSPYGTVPKQYFGVAYYVYRDGNQAIIKELSARSRTELEALRPFADDPNEVFTGDDGPPCSVGGLINFLLTLLPQTTTNVIIQ